MLRRPRDSVSCSLLTLKVLLLLGLAIAALPATDARAQDPADDLFGHEDFDDDELFGDREVGGEGESGEGADALHEIPAQDPNTRVPVASEVVESGSAAPPGEPDASIEEIVVEGQAGQGIATDASVSISAFDTEDLTAMGVEDVADVAQYTPNLEIRTAGATTPTFFIRGVGLNDFTANASGSVAVYQDDVALNLPAIQSAQIFDTEKLEILKGPQGGGPGRNASAGAIHVYSRKPTGEQGGFVRIDKGNFGLLETEAAIEFPIIQDILSSRSAFRITDRDGIVDNACGGFSRAEITARGGVVCGATPTSTLIEPNLPEELNDKRNLAWREQLLLVPPDTDLEILLNVHGGRIDQLASVGEALGTNIGTLGSQDRLSYRQPEITAEFNQRTDKFLDRGLAFGAARTAARLELARRLARRPLDRKPRSGAYNTPGFERMDTLGGFARIDLALDRVSFSSITGVEHYTRDRKVDADYSPRQLFEFAIDDDAWQVTQDVRATGELETVPLTWKLGAYYLQEDLNYFQETLVGDSLRGIRQEFVQKTWSFGVFAGFTWQFVDEFELELGARHNWERKSFRASVVSNGQDVCEPLVVFANPPDCDQTRSFGEPTGTIALSYFPSEEVSVYWRYSHGWKGAQFNARDGSPPQVTVDIAEPERIDAFEMGLSGNWFDGSLEIRSALFWYSYEDYQVFTFTNDADTPPQRVVLNANDAQLYGAEVEATLAPCGGLQSKNIESWLLDQCQGLEFTGRFGWLESKFLDFSDTGSRLLPGVGIFDEQVIDYNGNRLPNTPRFKLSGTLKWDIELGRFGSVVPRWDFTWTDDVAFDPAEGRGVPRGMVGNNVAPRLPDHTVGQKQYMLHNFRLTYRTPSGNVELTGWVQNIANEVYKTLAFDASQSVELVGNLVGDPRTYGGSIAITF